MKTTFTALAAFFAATAFASAAHTFFTPVSVTTTSTGDLWPVSNLIQGPGVGFDAAAPHNRTASGAGGLWVTAAPGGFPSDYIAVAGSPVLVFDLGGDTTINSIETWGYSTTNSNGVQDFSLRFATAADGIGGFGTSILDNPSLSMTIDDTALQSNGFSNVTAQYVEFTALSTFFGGGLAGGDRVGLGEVSFSIPEPSAAVLGLLSFGFILRRRR